MSKRNKVNKDFDVQCTSSNSYVVKTPDGKYLCVTQLTQKSKSTITDCASDCRYRKIIKYEKIGEVEQKIRDYFQQGKTADWLIKNTTYERSYIYKVKKKLKEEGILNNEQDDLEAENSHNIEEEKKAAEKTERIEEPKHTDINNTNHGIQTQFKRKSEQINIKPIQEREYLMLTEYPTVREALTEAIGKRPKWWSHNVKEIKEYIKTQLQKLPQSQIEGLLTTLQIVDLHERSRLQRGQSGWPAPLIIASSEPSQYLFGGKYTFKTLFREYDLNLPTRFETQKNRVVERWDQDLLEDLFFHLEEKAINQLGTLETHEFLEAQCNQLKAGNLNSYQKTQLSIKLQTNPYYQDDSRYPEIKDMLGLK